MRAWFPKSPGGRQQAVDAPDREPARLPPSPYSDQYETIIAQGHARPTPSFGAPALVWHVAIWPRRTVEGANGASEACDPHDTAGEKHDSAKALFEERTAQWLEQINLFLSELQSRSSRKPAAGRQFKQATPHDLASWPGADDGVAEAGGGADAAEHPALGGMSADTTDRTFFRPIQVLEEEIVPFTLWWGEQGEDAAPEADAIRVCVHPEVNPDYAAFSFYMDVGQRWNEPHIPVANAAVGGRRGLLLAAVDDIRRICDAQLDPAAAHGAAAVDLPAIPEFLHSPDRRTHKELHDALKAHRNLLYADIWEAFSREMGARLEDIAGARGEVFANFRGLIMSTAGMAGRRTGHPGSYQAQGAETASVGTVPFASFSADPGFTADGVEPNAVVKAYWPFVRRITPRADYRELVACGVLDWRAIYITALGSHSQYAARQEREPSFTEEGEASIRVPGHLLSDDEKHLAAVAPPFDSMVRKRAGSRPGNNHPVRYLLLTKHEPHPRQIGRIAERINTMGTMRLYAFKDWAAVRNADPYLRIFGQELDQITKQWSSDRRLINRLTNLRAVNRAAKEVRRLHRALSGIVADKDKQQFIRQYVGRDGWTGAELIQLGPHLPGYIPRSVVPRAVKAAMFVRFFFNWRRYSAFMKSMDNDLVADMRHRALYEISNQVETDLITISAKLDELGFGAVGGLHFRLNRSAYYVGEFYTLLATLRVHNIATWISYEQFVQRGLSPAFDYMKRVAERLAAVRARLLTIMETIETSALVGQSAATRHNTSVLRESTTFAVLTLLLFLAASSDWGKTALAHAMDIAGRLLAYGYLRLPAWLTDRIAQILTWFESLLQ